MSNSSEEDWLRVLSSARASAALNMRLSNELLSLVDDLLTLKRKYDLPEDAILPLAMKVLKISEELTEQSKQTSVSVWKLAGNS